MHIHISAFPPCGYTPPDETQYFYDLGLNSDTFLSNPRDRKIYIRMAGLLTDSHLTSLPDGFFTSISGTNPVNL